LSFTSVPSPNPTQTAAVTENGYTGAYSIKSSSCSEGTGNTSGNVATVSPSGGTVPGTLTVTAQGAGQCVFTYMDATSQTATLTVNVTTTGIIVNGRKKHGTTVPLPPAVTPALPTASKPVVLPSKPQVPPAKPLSIPAPAPGATPTAPAKH
jgi:hypothetical protein